HRTRRRHFGRDRDLGRRSRDRPRLGAAGGHALVLELRRRAARPVAKGRRRHCVGQGAPTGSDGRRRDASEPRARRRSARTLPVQSSQGRRQRAHLPQFGRRQRGLQTPRRTRRRRRDRSDRAGHEETGERAAARRERGRHRAHHGDHGSALDPTRSAREVARGRIPLPPAARSGARNWRKSVPASGRVALGKSRRHMRQRSLPRGRLPALLAGTQAFAVVLPALVPVRRGHVLRPQPDSVGQLTRPQWDHRHGPLPEHRFRGSRAHSTAVLARLPFLFDAVLRLELLRADQGARLRADLSPHLGEELGSARAVRFVLRARRSMSSLASTTPEAPRPKLRGASLSRREKTAFLPVQSRLCFAGAEATMVPGSTSKRELQQSSPERADDEERVSDIRALRSRVEDAYLHGERDFSGRDLAGLSLAVLTLEGANLSGCSLRRSDLSRVNLAEASLPNADLRDAICNEIVLTRANLEGADVAEACFDGANLGQVRMGAVKADGASFKGAELTRSDWSAAHLVDADYSDSQGAQASFTRANLSAARFDRAVLLSADFSGADLRKASFANAELERADLRDALLAGTNFGNAN